MADVAQYHGVGRRKNAIARVWLKAGEQIKINERSIEDYLPRENLRLIALQPLKLAELLGKLEVKIAVEGGGLAGQAGAISHGISRALLVYNADLKPVLKKAGLLTRDARAKERKKTGLLKARKRHQWTKR